MTPQEHLAQAEMILNAGPEQTSSGHNMTDLAMSVHALAHAVIALAAEMGVPHQPPGLTGGGAGVVQAP